MSLQGKVALITGASRGIGAGIALEFARKGIAALAITYASRKESAEEVLAKARDLGVQRTVAIQANILDDDIGPKLIPQVLEGLETKIIDIVVNNAVVNDVSLVQPITQTTANVFGKVFQGNVFAPISVISAALPYLPPKDGRIINISSASSKTANIDPIIVYGASKAALDSITRSFALQYGLQTNATFNSISVGATNTDSVQAAITVFGQSFLDQQISAFTTEKRLGEPEDVAYVVAFIASVDARWINGANVPVNGGHKDLLALQG